MYKEIKLKEEELTKEQEKIKKLMERTKDVDKEKCKSN